MLCADRVLAIQQVYDKDNHNINLKINYTKNNSIVSDKRSNEKYFKSSIHDHEFVRVRCFASNKVELCRTISIRAKTLL